MVTDSCLKTLNGRILMATDSCLMTFKVEKIGVEY